MPGSKFDQDKTRLDLLPQSSLWAVAEILTHGADKYGDRNWEEGIEYHRLFGAILRHLMQWWNHEDYDLESRQLHLAHAACDILMLLHYVLNYHLYGMYDDRLSTQYKILGGGFSVQNREVSDDKEAVITTA